MTTTETTQPTVTQGNDPACRYALRTTTVPNQRPHHCVDAFGRPWARGDIGPRPGTHCAAEMERRAIAQGRRERMIAAGAYDPDCAYCVTNLGPNGDGFAPSHKGSTGCESGAIAAGGSKSHCSCDRCF